jgi:hypothetical protein
MVCCAPRGPKLSTTNTATPISVSDVTHCFIEGVTPALPCISTTAGALASRLAARVRSPHTIVLVQLAWCLRARSNIVFAVTLWKRMRPWLLACNEVACAMSDARPSNNAACARYDDVLRSRIALAHGPLVINNVAFSEWVNASAILIIKSTNDKFGRRSGWPRVAYPNDQVIRSGSAL